MSSIIQRLAKVLRGDLLPPQSEARGVVRWAMKVITTRQLAETRLRAENARLKELLDDLSFNVTQAVGLLNAIDIETASAALSPIPDDPTPDAKQGGGGESDE